MGSSLNISDGPRSTDAIAVEGLITIVTREEMVFIGSFQPGSVMLLGRIECVQSQSRTVASSFHIVAFQLKQN